MPTYTVGTKRALQSQRLLRLCSLCLLGVRCQTCGLPGALLYTAAMTADENLENAKSSLRQVVLAVRSAAHRQAGERVGQSLVAPALKLVAQFEPAAVSAYVPMRSEMNCRLLLAAIAAAGITTAVPVMVRKAAPLAFRAYVPGDQLAKTSFGVEEPLQSALLVVPDLLFVPLAAFDEEGFRLGYGGGYYDRTLAELRAMKRVTAIGLAYDCQLVASVPRGAYDQRLDGVLTPSGLRSFPENL